MRGRAGNEREPAMREAMAGTPSRRGAQILGSILSTGCGLQFRSFLSDLRLTDQALG